MSHRYVRWLLAALNAALITCAIGTDVTMTGSWPLLAVAVVLTMAAMAMLPYFWIKTRRGGDPDAS